MALKLTNEQRQAVESAATRVRLIDEHTNTVYVLIRADLYERLKDLLEHDELSKSYPAQMESAMRAGWDDPAMDEYNHYDENRKNPCP